MFDNNRTMYDAVCSECKKECQVPFKPDPNKGPIFCRECFLKRRNK